MLDLQDAGREPHAYHFYHLNFLADRLRRSYFLVYGLFVFLVRDGDQFVELVLFFLGNDDSVLRNLHPERCKFKFFNLLNFVPLIVFFSVLGVCSKNFDASVVLWRGFSVRLLVRDGKRLVISVWWTAFGG